jgi:hypothetical protein
MSNLLGPISELDDHKAYRRYFAGPARERTFNGHDLGRVIDAAVSLSVEYIWPSLLSLSRRAKEGDIALSNGWSIRSVETIDTYDSAFVMEHEDTPGGFVFNAAICKLLPEGSGSACFKPSECCDLVSTVTCCAYRADGLFPPGYDGYGHDLQGTLEKGFDGSQYQVGQLFISRPSAFRQLMSQEPDRITLNPSSPVSDPAMALEALELLGFAFDELGYTDSISERRRKLGDAVIEHFFTGEADALLVELGVATLLGTPGERTASSVRHFFAQAAALDFERQAERLAAVIAKLRADGHLTEDTAFEWGDSDRQAFVARATGGGGVLWLTTQQYPYRIDYLLEEPTAAVKEITVSMPGNTRTSADPKPEPGSRGYLGEFVREDSGPAFSIFEIADFDTRNIRGMNGIVSVIQDIGAVFFPEPTAT